MQSRYRRSVISWRGNVQSRPTNVIKVSLSPHTNIDTYSNQRGGPSWLRSASSTLVISLLSIPQCINPGHSAFTKTRRGKRQASLWESKPRSQPSRKSGHRKCKPPSLILPNSVLQYLLDIIVYPYFFSLLVYRFYPVSSGGFGATHSQRRAR